MLIFTIYKMSNAAATAIQLRVPIKIAKVRKGNSYDYERYDFLRQNFFLH